MKNSITYSLITAALIIGFIGGYFVGGGRAEVGTATIGNVGSSSPIIPIRSEFPYKYSEQLENAMSRAMASGIKITPDQQRYIRAHYAEIEYVTNNCPDFKTLSNSSSLNTMSTILSNCASSTTNESVRSKLNIAKKDLETLVSSVTVVEPRGLIPHANAAIKPADIVGLVVSGAACALGQVWSCLGFVADIIILYADNK